MTEAAGISAAQEDYLEAILALEIENGRVRVRDLAEQLSVHKSTVTAALKALTEKDLIEYEPYGRIVLTRKGRKAAEQVCSNHAAVKTFLTNVLLIDTPTAESNACRMEHVVDRSVMARLVAFAAFMTRGETPGADCLARFKTFLAERDA